MTACSSVLGAVLSKTESTWGENVATFSSPTRHPITQTIDLSGLTQDKIDPARVVQYRTGDCGDAIPGIMGGSFKLRGHLHGHGAATTGATAMTDLGNFLAWMLGAGAASAASGSTFTGAGSATAPATNASGTFTAGSMCRADTSTSPATGAQFYAISTHVTTTLTLLTALSGTPNANSVLYSAETIYSDPTVCTVSESKRFFLPTADQTRIAHGCFPMALTIGGTNPGEIPFWEATIGCSWWEPEASLTFPVTTAGDTFNPVPNAMGSVFFNNYGTATQALLDVRQWSVDIKLGIAPIIGLGGVSQYQTIVGVKRLPDEIMVNMTLDAAGASASPTYYAGWATGGKYHMLATLNGVATAAVGLYFPVLRYAGQRPSQVDLNGRNAVNVSFKAYANEAVTTSGLTMSPIRIGLA